MRDVVLAAIMAVLVPASFFWPFLGILAWTWVSYFNPHRFAWSFTRELPLAQMVAIPTLLGLAFAKERRLPPMTRETFLLLLLWIWFGLTTINVYFSDPFFHHLPETVNRLREVSKILLIVFVSMMLVTSYKKLRWWYLVTIGSFALFSLKGFIFGLRTEGQFTAYGPGGSMIGDNNALALALNISLPMFFYLPRAESSLALRLAMRLSFLLAVVTIILTYSRGGLLGLASVLAALAVKSRRKLLAGVGILIFVLAVFIAAPEKWTERMETLKTAKETDPSALARLRSWEFSTRLALDNPTMGGGFQTFTDPLYDRYGLGGGPSLGPHSIYFQVLAEHGFPGLLLFLSLLGFSFFSCRKLQRRFGAYSETPNVWIEAYANAIQVGLVAYAVSGAFLGHAYFDLYYQLVATVIILKSLARAEIASTKSELLRDFSHSQGEVAMPAFR